MEFHLTHLYCFPVRKSEAVTVLPSCWGCEGPSSGCVRDNQGRIGKNQSTFLIGLPNIGNNRPPGEEKGIKFLSGAGAVLGALHIFSPF